MFDDETEEITSCSMLAEECRHNPLFQVDDDESGEDLGSQQNLSDIIALISDEHDEDTVDAFRRVLELDIEESAVVAGMNITRVE
jgi:hypothetical protein